MGVSSDNRKEVVVQSGVLMIPEPKYDNEGASQCAPINIGKKEEARSFLLILSYVQRG